MAFVVAGLIKKDGTWLGLIRTICYAGTVMVAGYFIFDLLIMGDYDVAALSLPINVLQLIANGGGRDSPFKADSEESLRTAVRGFLLEGEMT